MQTTLLSLAVAVILALVAALVAPFVIDWGTYRSLFEKEASRMTGLDVHVRGDIEARLLPSPRIQLYNIEVGQGGGALRARSLAIEFALGPLLRGEWRADDMRLAGPQIDLAVDPAGDVVAPTFALNIDPDALSIDRLSIEDGKAMLSDAASGASVTLDRLWFNGELRSLVGPIKGEGAATVGGAVYPFRLSSGRVNSDGALRVRLNVDPVETPLNIEADGLLSLTQGKPQFQGTWSVTRPVGIASRGAVAAAVTQPWRFGGKIKLTPSAALMEQVDFRYGSDADAVKLNGTAELGFGVHPRFNGVLSARQIDLDKIAGEDEASHAPPAATIRRLAALAGQAFRPPFPIQLGIGIDLITLGGTELQNLRGDVSTAAGGWTLDRFEFRAPGLSDVRLSGRLGFEPSGVVFTGPADIASNDPNAFAAWLEGRKDAPATAPRPLRLRGDVTLGNEKIAIERLNASFNRGAINGRFVYAFGAGKAGSRIDANLSAPQLDIDALSSFAKALLAGSTVERPSEVTLALDVGRASYAGIEAGKTNARLQYGASGLTIEQLSIENFGGATVGARGQIALAPSPHGDIAVDLDARDLTGVNAIVGRYLPQLAERLRVLAPAMSPAKLHGDLKVDNDAGSNHAVLTVNGVAGIAKVSLNGDGIVDASALNLTSLRVQSQVDAADGAALAALLGVDRLVTVTKEPATLRATLSGNPFGDLTLNGWMSAPALTASTTGTVRVMPGEWPTGSIYLNVAKADLTPLRGVALPVAVTAHVTSDGQTATIDEISAVIAGSKLRGKLTASLATPRRVDGALDADTLDVAALLGAATGAPKLDGPWKWSSSPFGAGLWGGVSGRVALTAMDASLAPTIAARQFRASVTLADGAVAFDDVSGSVAGGNLTGKAEFKPGADGLAAKVHIALDNGDVAALLPHAARPPVSGRLSVEINLEGTGRSPVALIGSLHGQGKIKLVNGQLAGLDPRAFAAVTRAVDQGLPVEASRIEKLAASALENGQLAVSSSAGDLAINAGQTRLNDAKASGGGADLSMSGMFDLTNGLFNARLVLTGANAAAGTRPDIFVALHGPLNAAEKDIDVSGLTGWLTLRAIDQQSKKLDAIEAAPAPEPAPAPKAEPKPAASTPPAAPTPKPKEPSSAAAKKPAAPPRSAAVPPPQAPSLPPPINILPAPAVR